MTLSLHSKCDQHSEIAYLLFGAIHLSKPLPLYSGIAQMSKELFCKSVYIGGRGGVKIAQNSVHVVCTRPLRSFDCCCTYPQTYLSKNAQSGSENSFKLLFKEHNIYEFQKKNLVF